MEEIHRVGQNNQIVLGQLQINSQLEKEPCKEKVLMRKDSSKSFLNLLKLFIFLQMQSNSEALPGHNRQIKFLKLASQLLTLNKQLPMNTLISRFSICDSGQNSLLLMQQSIKLSKIH